MQHNAHTPSTVPPLMRRREVAQMLAISQSMVAKLERQGAIEGIRLPAARAVRYRTTDVLDLLASWAGAAQHVSA